MIGWRRRSESIMVNFIAELPRQDPKEWRLSLLLCICLMVVTGGHGCLPVPMRGSEAGACVRACNDCGGEGNS
jgi:hypothetical protein